jgi:hypothetical protein
MPRRAGTVHDGRSHRCGEPEIIPVREAAAGFAAGELRILRLMGVAERLRMRRVDAAR